MARGGYRPGAGRPRKNAPPKPPQLTAPNVGSADFGGVPVSDERQAKDQKTPLSYMLGVMNDETADATRRDRMAIAAAPFMHTRMGEDGAGKRDKEAEAAKQGATGKFAPPTPPRLVVDNK